MTRRLLYFLSLSAVFANAVSGAMINGTLNLRAGSVIDHPNISLATGILSWTNPAVANRNGDFIALISEDQAVSLVAPWSFESGPVNHFWSVGGFIFDLVGSEIVEQTASRLTVTGSGFIRGNGFDPTPGSWNYGRQVSAGARALATQPSGFSWLTFTATPPSASVPDSGSTVTMLIGGLVGLGFVGRSFRTRSRT